MVNPIFTLNTPPIQAYTLASLSIDGVRLRDLQDLYDLNTATLGGQRWNSPNQFWASPARPAQSPIREVLEISLNSAKTLNHLSFQVSRFPCRIWVEWLNPDTGKWRPVMEPAKKGSKKRRPVQITVNESVPQRVRRHVADTQHRHPQHRAAGHWRTINMKVKPFGASKVRLIIARVPSKHIPIEIGTGKPVPYSIAVKDFQVGFQVSSRADLWPVQHRTQNVEASETFSSTIDLLGSSIEFSLVEYRASDLLWPTLQAIEGLPEVLRDGDAEIWKCEPQPFPWAVVNLYADARDNTGAAQVIDRFFLDPTTPQVRYNLYYSNDIPDATLDFIGSDEPIRYPGLQMRGSVLPEATGNRFLSADSGYIDINRKVIHTDRSAPWWMGFRISPQFASTSTSDWTIFETPYTAMKWSGTALGFRFEINGRVIERTDLAFDANQEIAIVIAHLGEGQIALAMDDDWGETLSVDILDLNISEVLRDTHPELLDYIRFGGGLVAPGSDPGRGNYLLNGFVYKSELLDDERLGDFFSHTADEYLRPASLDAEEDLDFTQNALLRMLPYYATSGINSRNPFGFVGGPGTPFESLTWTPITRDFVLQKGFIKFNPVQARFFKFEFTGLAPQPYSSFEPVMRTVRLFAADTISDQHVFDPTGGATASDPGINTTMNLIGQPIFSDQRRVEHLVNPDLFYDGYTPTEALYSTDPAIQQRLQELNPMFRLSPWRTAVTPRFTKSQVHRYETVEVEHNSNTAYFVGLNQIRMYRVDYTQAEDTDAYLVPFYDRLGLDDENDARPWSSLSPNGLVVNSLITSYAQTTSKPLLSRRNVRGIQFATMQTPARQLLRNSEFTDPDMRGWTFYGGAVIEPNTDFQSDIGSMLKVTRRADGSYWDYLEDQYPTWDSIEVTGATWDEIGNLPEDSQSFGGVVSDATGFIQPAPGGRLYAAARVYVPRALDGPLHLQLITSEGEVLAEEIVSPKAGSVFEWYCSYTIGDAGDYSGVPTWDEVETLYPVWDSLENEGTWDDIMGGIKSPYDGTVGVRLFQAGPTNDVFYVDNLSIFEDPIVWEFSNDGGETWWPAYDIRNNPNGALLFPSTPEDALVVSDNLSLRWRVTSYRAGVKVTALYIRPWYSTLRFGPAPRETLDHGGPNLSKYDQYPSVEDSPPFKTWSKPIPETWWFHYRQWLLQGGIPGAIPDPEDTSLFYLNDSLLYPTEGSS